jgi:hypothetical protein
MSINVRGPVTKNVLTRPLGLLQIRVGPSAVNIATNTPVLTSLHSVGALASSKFTDAREFYEFTSGFPKTVDAKECTSIKTTLEGAVLEFTPKLFALAAGIDIFAGVSATAVNGVPVSTAGTIDGTKSIAVNNSGGVISDEFTVYFTGAAAGAILSKTKGLVHTFSALDAAMEPQNADASNNLYFSIPASFFTGTWASGDIFTFRTTAYISGTDNYSDDYAGSVALGVGGLPAYVRIEAVQQYGYGHSYTVILPRSQVISSVDVSQAETEGNIPMQFEGTRADSAVSGGNAAWDDYPTGRLYWVNPNA